MFAGILQKRALCAKCDKHGEYGAFFQLLVLPLIFNFDADPKVAEEMLGLSIMLLIVVSWNLAVYAHLFRESFGVRLPAAMILTVCYIVITLMVRKIFFPEIA